jgi:hypothetical protein
MEADQPEELMLVPPNGFSPLDFPAIAVALIAYNASATIRPDPHMTIRDDGWLYIETGNVRVAVPDREEWAKLVTMGERLWNTHELAMRQRAKRLENHDELLPATMSGRGGEKLKENNNGVPVDPDECGPG